MLACTSGAILTTVTWPRMKRPTWVVGENTAAYRTDKYAQNYAVIILKLRLYPIHVLPRGREVCCGITLP